MPALQVVEGGEVDHVWVSTQTWSDLANAIPTETKDTGHVFMGLKVFVHPHLSDGLVILADRHDNYILVMRVRK